MFVEQGPLRDGSSTKLRRVLPRLVRQAWRGSIPKAAEHRRSPKRKRPRDVERLADGRKRDGPGRTGIASIANQFVPPEKCVTMAPLEIRPMTSRRTLRKIGTLILVIGLLGAGLAYWAARRQEARAQAMMQAEGDGADPSLSPDDSKVYQRDSEWNMGKGVIVIDRFLQAIGQLFQGRSLVFTIAVISVILGFGCFALADRAP